MSEFWVWFVNNSDNLQPCNITHEWIRVLQRKLDELIGDIGWEIGPVGNGDRSSFSLSPTSEDMAVNDLARVLIGLAPVVPGWIIQLYKPPRDWDLYFSFNVLNSKHVEVDGKEWLVAAQPDGGGGWAVDFVCSPKLPPLSEEVLTGMAWTILDGELGTEKSSRLISSVRVWKAAHNGAVPLIPGLLAGLIQE